MLRLTPIQYLLGNLALSSAIAALVLALKGQDALLYATIIPVIWSAFSSPKRLYLPLLLCNSLIAVAVVSSLFHNPFTSIKSIIVAFFSVLLLSEAIFRVNRKAIALQQQLEQSEHRLVTILSHIQQAVWLANKDHFLYLSPAFDKIWGRPLSGSTLHKELFLSFVLEQDRPKVLHYLTHHLSEPQEIEYQIQLPDGSLRLIRDSSFPIKSIDSITVTGVAEDITERRRLEDDLRQSQKMDLLGRMAASVAHDFNNLLTVIQSYSYVLKSRGLSEKERTDVVSQIELAVDRASALTRRLLGFTRKNQPTRQVVDLNQLVKSSMGMFVRLLDPTIRLNFKATPDPIPIDVDQAMLDQAMLNLIINARDAMPEGGTITIMTSVGPADSNSSNPGEATACLSIADSGIGMSPKVLANLFRPFFTTKAPGKGTGLGLAAVHRTVTENNGRIEVSSTVGHGSIFNIFFPLASPHLLRKPPLDHSTTLPSTQEGIILFVEDDPQLRDVTKRLLVNHGYTVIDCRSAIRALELWQGLRHQCDLLLTDVTFPDGFSGLDLAAELRNSSPSLPILFTTANILTPETITPLNATSLTKPYEPEHLLNLVKAAIPLPSSSQLSSIHSQDLLTPDFSKKRSVS